MSQTTCLLDDLNSPLNNNGASSSGGVWTYTSGLSDVTVGGTTYSVGDVITGTDNPCVTFDDTDSSFFGDYVFTYDLTQCGGSSADLTVVFVGGKTFQNPQSCTYTIQTDPQWSVVVGNNSTLIEASVEISVSNSCTGIDGGVETKVVSFESRNCYKVPNTAPIINGGFIENLRVAIDDGLGNVTYLDINLTPTVGNPNLTGLNTVIFTDLIYNSGSPSTWQTAVTQVIQNAIFNNGGGQQGVNFEFTMVGVFGTSIRPTLCFVNKNNPSSTWTGIDVNNQDFVYNRNGVLVSNTYDFFTSYETITNDVNYTYETPCGFLFGTVANTAGGINPASFVNSVNFNSIVPAIPPVFFIAGDGNSTTSLTCDVIELGAALIPSCAGTRTYLWSNGSTDPTITVDDNSGDTYTVTLGCSDYPCDVNFSITII